jgi:HD-GYP domain-containing protein (c-di-GMP phosphodiesterase class II)
MTLGEAEKVEGTLDHELFTTRLVLGLYDFLPEEKQRLLGMQYPDFHVYRGKLKIAGEHHDFGKRSWPADLLCSDRHPTRDEWFDWVIPHPEVSARSFRGQLGPDSVIEGMILYHHVRYDGVAVMDITPNGRRVPDYAGYPDGIGGDDIPFGARMMKICDAVAAMVAKRNYRTGEITAEEAMRQISERAGTEYDPMLAELFCSRFTPKLIDRLADEEMN